LKNINYLNLIPIKYSIIVATYNRMEELSELINSVQHLTFPKNNFELVIIDDGSTDGTETFIAQLQNDVNIR